MKVKDKTKTNNKNCGQELALANHESLIFTWNNPVVHASLKAQIVQMNVFLILVFTYNKHGGPKARGDLKVR